MKILHFSDEGLPDTRIERYALIQSQNGYEPYFCGNTNKRLWLSNNFKEITYLPAEPTVKLGLPYFYPKFRKKFKKIYTRIQPDIIHAHNLITAKTCLDLNLQYIYDDHEYWSKQIAARSDISISLFSKRRFTNRRFLSFVNKFEKKIIQNAAAVITVSETIAAEHARWNSNVFTISNFPTSYETEKITHLNQPTDKLKAVLVTVYESNSEKETTDRIIKICNDINFELDVIGPVDKKFPHVKYLGFIPHVQLLSKLSDYHLGILTMPAHELRTNYYHYYNPNRIFLFCHAGVTPIIHEKMTPLKNIFGDLCITVDSESQIKAVIERLKGDSNFLSDRPAQIQAFAREKIRLEKLFDVMRVAYESVVKM